MTVYLMLLLQACQCSCPSPFNTYTIPASASEVRGIVTETNAFMRVAEAPTCSPPSAQIDFTMNRETAVLKLASGYRVWSVTLGGGILTVQEVLRKPRPQEFTIEESDVEVGR